MKSFTEFLLAESHYDDPTLKDLKQRKGPLRSTPFRLDPNMPMRKPSIPLPGVPRIPIFPDGHRLGRDLLPDGPGYYGAPSDQRPDDGTMRRSRPPFDGDIPRYLDPNKGPSDNPDFRKKPGPYLKPEYEYVDPIPLKPYKPSAPGRVVEPQTLPPLQTRFERSRNPA